MLALGLADAEGLNEAEGDKLGLSLGDRDGLDILGLLNNLL